MGAAYGALHFELGVRALQGLAANFHKADQEAQREIKAAVRQSAEDTLALAIMLCPKRTGFMSENIKVRYTASELAFEVGWEAADFYEAGFAFYPFFVEFGTRFMSAQPSLGPAWEHERSAFEQNVAQAIRSSIARLH